MDGRLRELERRSVSGDEDARIAFIRAQISLGGRDPRRDPLAGDVVRVPRHGQNVWRWDERRVVPCEEARKWPQGKLPFTAGAGGYCPCQGEHWLKTDWTYYLHWERTERSLESLRGWLRMVKERGTVLRNATWKAWALKGEVVRIEVR